MQVQNTVWMDDVASAISGSGVAVVEVTQGAVLVVSASGSMTLVSKDRAPAEGSDTGQKERNSPVCQVTGWPFLAFAPGLTFLRPLQPSAA